jgi:hypothetical protein
MNNFHAEIGSGGGGGGGGSGGSGNSKDKVNYFKTNN